MIVVDASVWLSVLLEADSFHARSYSWLEEYSAINGEIAAPSLVVPEVAAGLARRTSDAVAGRAAIDYLIALTNLHIVPIDHQLAIVAAELASDYRLRGADAIYAALAYTLDIPLITWDHEQMTRVQEVVKAGTPGTFFGSNGDSSDFGNARSNPPNDD